ncbi:hypothetical protein [Streptomyces sp. NPDC089919]|uniref:hypothetical protein n=1 Tax=Streptomyces sp. NPDC089919 TaxID=3155188 RepID=UPI0034432290
MKLRRTPPRPARRPAGAVPLALVLLALAAAATGCGGAGRLESAGPTPVASGPLHLWPGHKGATVPPVDPGGQPPEYVQGIPPVKDQDVHGVDPLALVKAEIAANPDVASGPEALPPETAQAIKACTTAAAPGCPVLAPYYRDLTGNGHDELIIGIALPQDQLAVRAYTADQDGRLNRIMGTIDSVISVEVAGRDVILRVPGGNPGYELIIAWSWDEKQRTMLPTRDQVVRVTQPRRSRLPRLPATGPSAAAKSPSAAPTPARQGPSADPDETPRPPSAAPSPAGRS